MTEYAEFYSDGYPIIMPLGAPLGDRYGADDDDDDAPDLNKVRG